MAWDGWFAYGGNEIVNVTRTETYLRNGGHHWFTPLFENDALPPMLGDADYTTPLHDNPPWADPDDPNSTDFYGFYPLGISGVEDSTAQASGTEALGEGGSPGAVRHGMRTVVFNGMILARTEAAAEYGLRWLKRALDSGPCGAQASSICNGLPLCYLSSEPDAELDEPLGIQAILDGGFMGPGEPPGILSYDGAGAAEEPTETLLDGGGVLDTGEEVVSGGAPAFSSAPAEGARSIAVSSPELDGGGISPNPTAGFDGGGTDATAQTIEAGVATFPFDTLDVSSGNAEDCLAPFLRTLYRVVVAPGPTVESKRTASDGAVIWNVQFTAVAGNPAEYGVEVPVVAGFLDPSVPVPWAGGVVPDGGAIDLDGYIATGTDCAEQPLEAVYDPLFPATILPPGPPNVPLGNYSPPLNWRRRQFTIPKQYVPLWGEVVPVLQVHARTADLRNLRVRFYADPYKIGDVSDDPCSYCGDLVISYVPQDHTLVVDGVEGTVYVLTNGGVRRRADSLVYKTDGTPFEWPALTCGFGYVVTLDLPQTQEPPVVDLSLYPRAV